MQQHSKSPQSMHFVRPGLTPAGFAMEEPAEEGRAKRMGDARVRDPVLLHIFFVLSFFLSWGGAFFWGNLGDGSWLVEGGGLWELWL